MPKHETRNVFYQRGMIENRVQIKHIAIVKCDLIFHYRDAKEISFYNFRDKKLCAKHEKTHVNSIYVVGIMFVR